MSVDRVEDYTSDLADGPQTLAVACRYDDLPNLVPRRRYDYLTLRLPAQEQRLEWLDVYSAQVGADPAALCHGLEGEADVLLTWYPRSGVVVSLAAREEP
ncbi:MULTISPECIES: hypothetical protein [unclassified Actinomyces]|uniref:hypothetical protein n=1 Tax=unclassified Actinomyces TaxID=2609248 RepID=UPI0020180205|nr:MULTISPECIES: hypothetical protein [unclassified Actinomyces]MCL3777765.1 hypothetical protein [Actinomyces sp. AC-20-1]MCL3789473.1 hypothetical protein [Actinomyces sp. 187325]MCL3791776.1 hypothetical protein [Actinomyces sp. 186855]MCL3794866.1 hypothetical protein [Actinomyces sp. 217892]